MLISQFCHVVLVLLMNEFLACFPTMHNGYHRRSQDFVWGCSFFLNEVDDLFSRRLQKTVLNELGLLPRPNLKRSQ